METCLFRGKKICSLDVLDVHGNLNTMLEKEWRLASNNGNLKCEDCGSIVIFKCGQIKIPHFAHKSVSLRSNCFYKSYPESEERRKAKFLIYNYLKECYDPKFIQVNREYISGIRSDFFIETDNQKIAIELQRLEVKTELWDLKNKAYKTNKITPVWILVGKNKDKYDYKDFRYFKRLSLCDTDENILRIIDTECNTLTLVKELKYIDPKTNKLLFRDVFAYKYDLINDEVPKGEIYSDFMSRYKHRQDKFLEESRKKASITVEKKNQTMLHNLKLGSFLVEKPKKTVLNNVDYKSSEVTYICELCNEETKESDCWTYTKIKGTCKCNKCKSQGKY